MASKRRYALTVPVLAAVLAALSAPLGRPVLADTRVVQYPIAVQCTSKGQICFPLWTMTITTDSQLDLSYTAPGHCSSVRVHIFVDGVELPPPLSPSVFIGWKGGPPSLPIDTGVIHAGPVSAGDHLLGLQAEGRLGGCNIGLLAGWGGTVTVSTSYSSATQTPTDTATASPTSTPAATPTPTATATNTPTPDFWKAGNAIDGSLDTGWESAAGYVNGQSFRVGFADGGVYRISSVMIDPAATHGDSADADLKDFRLLTSTDGAMYTTALTGTCRQSAGLQRFLLPAPVDAAAVELDALSNYGSSQHVAVAELEVYGTALSSSRHLLSSLSSAERTSGSLGQVRYIHRGLSVAPAHTRTRPARIKMPVYSGDQLQTSARQKASIGFLDRTVLHINQLTSAVLRSTHLTYVNSGEVEEVVQPGTNHSIQTASVVASAVGTIFDVRVTRGETVVVVVEGAVLVSNAQGSVLVKTGEMTTVRKGEPPALPQPANAQSATQWSSTIPTPDLGRNVALDANGGHIIGASS